MLASLRLWRRSVAKKQKLTGSCCAGERIKNALLCFIASGDKTKARPAELHACFARLAFVLSPEAIKQSKAFLLRLLRLRRSEASKPEAIKSLRLLRLFRRIFSI
jgi:hypothetical protein